MKVRITKCYLVQVIDKDENELASQYVFGDKDSAKEVGKTLKEMAKEETKPNINIVDK